MISFVEAFCASFRVAYRKPLRGGSIFGESSESFRGGRGRCSFSVDFLPTTAMCTVVVFQSTNQKFLFMSDSIVIIPTYNEKENIENIIRAVFALEKDIHILIIDDASPDGTAAIVRRLMREAFSDRLFLEERKGKLGLGPAFIHGFKWALARSYDYIFEMDADFSHHPNDLPRLYAACHNAGADLAVGSRYVSGVNVVNWPMGRVLMSYFASKYVRFITRLPVNDTTAGFVCYRRRVLEAIDFDRIGFKGYAFQIEMKFTAYVLGFKIEEVSVVFVNRRLGTSKMNSGIFGEAFFGVIELRWRKLTGKIRPRRTLLQQPS